MKIIISAGQKDGDGYGIAARGKHSGFYDQAARLRE